MHAPFALPARLSELGDEYELLSELGRGGSAVVYHARDRALRRDVAIKVVHPRATSPSDDPVARLAREARTVAQLQHPHIVTVYGVRRLHGGGLALIMQYVPGSTLKAVVQREGPLPPDRCERVLRDVARALAFAHARGIVHRDVKPENIFLDAESGRALLADFGIARTDEHESMTLTGTAIGTPFYMSPEQVEGAPLDGRSDLYSLGLVAWEMLTGRRPWDGESLYNVIYKQKHEELPPIEALRSGAPRRLQYIVERMLQKRPAARWAGADGLLAQLEHSVLPADFARWQTTLPGRIARFRAASSARPATLPPTHAAADQPAELPHTVGGAPTLQFVRDRPQALRGAGDGTPDVESSTAPPLAPPGGLADTLTFAPGDAIAPAAASSRPPAALHGDERAGPEEVTQPDRDAPAPAQSDVVAYGDAVEPTWGVPEDVPARATPRRPRWLAAGAVAASVLLLTAAAWRTWSVAERAPDDQARSIAAPGDPARDPARDPGADPQPGTPIAVGAALARGTAQSAGRSAPQPHRAVPTTWSRSAAATRAP
jgi:serine/threonine protein kinase